MNKKRMIAMVSTALLVTGCAEVGNAQTVAVENSGQSVQKNIVKSIQSQANPLKTIEPSKPFEDLKPLKNWERAICRIRREYSWKL